MISLTLATIADIVGGRLVLTETTDGDTVISGVSDTDSRKITPGDIFFAKPGEVTDGHRFAGKAVENGAALVIGERECDVEVPQIIVANTVRALGDLATEVVSRVRALGRMRVVAVTGSNGKTTTKNLLRSMFAEVGDVVAPIASFNNEVGAPTTFLRVTETTDTLVAEMGASRIGEIRSLTQMARPDVGIVLGVGLAHAGEFGGIDRVEVAKREMVEALPQDGVAVLNADDARVVRMQSAAPGRIVWFGRSERADVRATEVQVAADGTRFLLHVPREQPVGVHFPVIGEHHVMNALAASAAAWAEGVPITTIVRVLESTTLAERGRMEVVHAGSVTVINDAYNANPNSMAAALRTLAQIAAPGQRTIAVLGSMSELGEFSVAEHQRIGELAVRLRLSRTCVVGEDARPLYLAAVAEGSWDDEAVFFTDADEAFTAISEQLRPGDVVLVKSSNSAGLLALGDRLGEYAKGLDA